MLNLFASVLAGAVIVVAGFTGVAGAATITVSATIKDNDCSGYFGTGFGSCQIFGYDDAKKKVLLSPVIAKYKADLTIAEINDDAFPTFDGTEISMSGNKTGTWTYAKAVDDPSIRYWAAKGSNSFNLFWTVSDVDTGVGGACAGADKFTLACLSAALKVTSGSWFTPTNNGGNQADLSHITFYDSVDPTVVVPVPAAGLLLLSGIGGLAALRRRRKA